MGSAVSSICLVEESIIIMVKNKLMLFTIEVVLRVTRLSQKVW